MNNQPIRLTNHIAYRFLNDESLLWEIMGLVHPNLKNIKTEDEIEDGMSATWNLIKPQNNKNYYVTNTVLSKLDLLKVSRNEKGWYDYTIFSHLSNRKVTLIFPDNKLVRFVISDVQIIFDYIRFEPTKENKYEGQMNNCLYYIDKDTGEPCTHYNHSDVKEIEDNVYKMLCFLYLSDVTEVILQPGQSAGTRKTGKILNEIKCPIVVVDANWAITSIRDEEFTVSGHFRLQPYGQGRSSKRIQWIEPFKKEGYVRKAKMESE